MISYLLIRLFTFPFRFFPYRWIHAWGKWLGTLVFALYPKFRKRALSNLALAKDLDLSEKEILQIAEESCQNLLITLLEYTKFAKEKDITKIAVCENPKRAEEILNEKGIIFFCGHQANWEILFLEGTHRMPGVAIGRPIKNPFLYRWILSIREKFGGKVVPPKNAIKEGMRALKNKKFLGIVGDQGMPDSGFCSPFLGRLAWTSPIPAMLAYKMDCPLIVAITKRIEGKYYIHYSDPIYPALEETSDEEVRRLMLDALRIFEESIKEMPGQWLWMHNRWKQQILDKIKKRFRQDAIAIILPDNLPLLETLIPHLMTFREIYPTEFIEVFAPHSHSDKIQLPGAEMNSYATTDDILVKDYRPKLIFNFTDHHKLNSHFRSLSALEVVTLHDLKRISGISDEKEFSLMLKQAIFR